MQGFNNFLLSPSQFDGLIQEQKDARTRSSPIEALLISQSIQLNKLGITKLVILQQEAPGVWGIGFSVGKIGGSDNS